MLQINVCYNLIKFESSEVPTAMKGNWLISYKPKNDVNYLNISDVIQLTVKGNYQLDNCESACESIALASYNAMISSNSDVLADFLDIGLCEYIIRLMKLHGVVSAQVASKTCLIVSILCRSSDELRDYFGTLDVCDIIIFIISMHYGNPDVSEFGTAAVRMLGFENISNSFQLAEAGACDVMSQVGVFGFNIRNERSKLVAANVCYVFTHLSEAINIKRLVECSCCDLIVELLRVHRDDIVVVLPALQAICALASLSSELRVELGRIGTCNTTIDIITKKYPSNIELLQTTCELIMHLSLSPSNTMLLKNASACHLIVNALENKLLMETSIFGAEVCLGALLNMATYGSCAIDNRSIILSLNGVNIIRSILVSSSGTIKARENALLLLDLLGYDRVSGPSLKSAFVSDGSNFIGIFNVSNTTNTLQAEVRQYESFRDGFNDPINLVGNAGVKYSNRIRIDSVDSTSSYHSSTHIPITTNRNCFEDVVEV